MIISTTENLPNIKVIEILGLARGSVVRSKNAISDLSASIKQIFGGELSEYTALQSESRDQALLRMIQDAERLGADAVIALRFETSSISQGASEIFAYGTAVKIQK